ncbi:aspartate kinase [Chryseobacterium sp. A301]
MKVYKFGGASVKDAQSVRNVSRVLELQGQDSILVVVSAMGKTTNALEEVLLDLMHGRETQTKIRQIQKFHLEIANALFEPSHSIFQELDLLFESLSNIKLDEDKGGYDFYYDQLVSYGELISSLIVSSYLHETGFFNQWLDSRLYIRCDSTFREGEVDWKLTKERIESLDKNQNYVTQGFIGGDANQFTVTLGREGSDYSAAIFAYGLEAQSMTIWKDVPGVMTGDPRKFKDVELFSYISYEEAIEMAYYGASVIHPKTLQPLKKKDIPLFVRSFLNPLAPGTKVSSSPKAQVLESYILKEDQILLTVSTRDFSFIAEHHLSEIFALLYAFQIRISLMQTTAICLELCLEDKYNSIDKLMESLDSKFEVEIQEKVRLLTVRNSTIESTAHFYDHKTVLLEQMSRGTLQMVFQGEL